MQAKLSRLGPGYERLNVSWGLGEVSGDGGDLGGDTSTSWHKIWGTWGREVGCGTVRVCRLWVGCEVLASA